MDAIKYESITVSGVAIGFTSSLTSIAPVPLAAFLTVEDFGTAGLRFRADGVDPTAAEGHLLNDEDSILISGLSNLRRFRAIRVGAQDVTLRVTYLL